MRPQRFRDTADADGHWRPRLVRRPGNRYIMILLWFIFSEDPNFHRERVGRGRKIEIDFRSNRYIFGGARYCCRPGRSVVPREETEGKETRRKRSQKPERRGFSAEATKILAGPSHHRRRRCVIIFVRHHHRTALASQTPPQNPSPPRRSGHRRRRHTRRGAHKEGKLDGYKKKREKRKNEGKIAHNAFYDPKPFGPGGRCPRGGGSGDGSSNGNDVDGGGGGRRFIDMCPADGWMDFTHRRRRRRGPGATRN